MQLPEPCPPTPRSLLLAAIGALILAGALVPLDSTLVRWFNPAHPGPWDALLDALYRHAPDMMLAVSLVLGGGLWFFGRSATWRRGGVILALYPYVTLQLTMKIKYLVARPRPQTPEQGIDGLRILVESVDRLSFPSGHVTATAAFAVALLFALPGVRWRFAPLLLIPIMMWDRVALAAHFPSDTAAGLALALATLAGFGWILRRCDPTLHPGLRVPASFAGLLVMTWAWAGPARAVDAVTLKTVPGLYVEPRLVRALFEPFFGPPLEMAYVVEPVSFLLRLLPWAALGIVLIALFPRKASPVLRMKRLALLGTVVAIGYALFAAGRLPGDRFVSARGGGLFWDAGLRRDVSMTTLKRLQARGVNVVTATNSRVEPDPLGATVLPGCSVEVIDENRAQTLVAILGSAAACTPGSGQDADATIRDAHAQGAVAIVRDTMAGPDIEGLLAAGADGFAFAPRKRAGDPAENARRDAIDAICRERGLVRAAEGGLDLLSGGAAVTFVPGKFPGDVIARRDALIEHLRARAETVPVVFTRKRRDGAAWRLVEAPAAAFLYFGSLGPASRVSWMLWFLAAWWWLRDPEVELPFRG